MIKIKIKQFVKNNPFFEIVVNNVQEEYSAKISDFRHINVEGDIVVENINTVLVIHKNNEEKKLYIIQKF